MRDGEGAGLILEAEEKCSMVLVDNEGVMDDEEAAVGNKKGTCAEF